MFSTHQSLHGQMPGAYLAEEDEETHLQMINDLTGDERSVGPQQSKNSHTIGSASHQHQYASQNVPARESSHRMPTSNQKHYASRDVPANRPSHQKAAGRHHPYARPNVAASTSNHQTSAFVDHRMGQARPIRHSGNVRSSQGLSNSQLKFNPQEPSAQQHSSVDFENDARFNPPSYDVRISDFSRYGPSQGDFGNEKFPRPQTYSSFPEPAMPDDENSYQGQEYYTSKSRQDLQYAAYLERAATMHGASPYLASSANEYAASRVKTNINSSDHSSRPATGPLSLDQTPEFRSVEKEAEQPKTGKKKSATKAKRSNEEKKPSKSKAKGQTRFENGRLECVQDPDAPAPQWAPAIRMDDCRSELIDQQNHLAAQLNISYRDPDPAGTGSHDETAFKIEHADWGPDRAHLPGICWRYNEDEKNNPRPSDNPGHMRFKGMIILDPNDDPVKDWPQLPATLSSKTRGYRLEIMSRENPHLEYKDFIARMPSVIEKTKKDKDTGETEVVMEAPDPNVVCNMRMFRFRKEKGLLSWTEKGNTKVIGEGLEKLFGDKLTNNSMESFRRDLTPWEQIEIRKGKNAEFPDPKAAGEFPPQAVTKKGKNEGANKTVKKQSNATVQKSPRQKRPLEDDEDPDSADDQYLGQATAASYRKRRRNARGEASKPTINLENDQNLSATEAEPKIFEAESNIMPHASNYFSDDYYDEDGNSYLSEDEDDREYEIRTSRRPVRSLPARHGARGGAKKAPRFDAAHAQDQHYGSHRDVEFQRNATDEDSEEDMTDVDDLPDVPSSGKAHALVEDEVDEDVAENDEGDEPETAIPDQAPKHPYQELSGASSAKAKETDLEAHRKWVKEFLYEDQEDYASSLERRRTVPPPSRYPNVINPTKTSAATASPNDFSEVTPSTDREVGSLAVAMLPTKKMFWEWTGQTVPQPNREKSYGYQYRELHAAFEDWWSKNSQSPLPILVGVAHWGSSVDDWEPVKKDAVYYEAYKKGHRAPRDEYGELIDMPGPLLEKFADM